VNLDCRTLSQARVNVEKERKGAQGDEAAAERGGETAEYSKNAEEALKPFHVFSEYSAYFAVATVPGCSPAPLATKNLCNAGRKCC
jgi:hypothetical protein